MIQTGDAIEWPSTTKEAWRNQQLASQPKFYNADESQGYDIPGRIHLDRGEDLPGVILNNDAIASQDQYWHHGRMTDPETSEARFEPVPPQPAPSLFISQTEIGQDDSTPHNHELETLVPDQVCTCAACLEDYTCPEHLKGLGRQPEMKSWTFGCRVTGCQWTTKCDESKHSNNLEKLFRHDWQRERQHYGRYGDWRCRETGCKYVTKRWNDFTRHSSSKHCINPKNFECPVLNCKYHQIGFTRKDKLKSHFDRVHKGNSQPGKPNQAIKPKGKDSA